MTDPIDAEYARTWHVPAEEQLDYDDDDSTHAKTGGDDTDGLDDLRNEAGPVVPAEELQ